MVGPTRVTLPSTSGAPITLIRAVWLTRSLPMSRVGTMPIRSNSLRAMIENSASPRPDAIAPITAVELPTSPPTGACTTSVPPSGSNSRASVCPAVTVSPASARISITFSPCRSGRTKFSSRARTMPYTSTIAGKHAFAAFSTVTVAPFGASASSAARLGRAARQSSAAAREKGRGEKGGIGNPWRVLRAYR